MKLSRSVLLLLSSLFVLSPSAEAGIATKIIGGIVKSVVTGVAKGCYKAFDKYDVGVHVYINSNIIVDPAVKDKYDEIWQEDNWKSSIGIYVADIEPKNEGANCYVRNTKVHASSKQASAAGYYHADNGAASGNSVGGVMGTEFNVEGYEGYAIGILTDAGTSFSGGTIVTIDDGTTETLAVSGNYIKLYDHGDEGITNMVHAYGIFANGDWSGVDIVDNTIKAHVYSGTATGIHVVTDQFVKSTVTTQEINVASDTGSAIGISFQLDEDAGTLRLGSIDNSTLKVSNLEGGSDDNSSATGIFIGDGNIDIASINNVEINASTQGVIALGLAVVHDTAPWSTMIHEFRDSTITVNAANGLAAGIYVEPMWDNDSEYFIDTIKDVSITVSSKGNVYGYVLGAEAGVGESADDDAGYGFYNANTYDSSNIAKNMDFQSISVSVTSTGANGYFDGNSAYGIYLENTKLDASEDISFADMSVSAAGTAYALLLNNSSMEAPLCTNFTVSTLSEVLYGAYLEGKSTMSELSGSILLSGVNNYDYKHLAATAIYLEEGSAINKISSTLNLDLYFAQNSRALWMENADSNTVFQGTIQTSSYHGAIQIYDRNFYAYLIGMKLPANETLLIYNEETANSEGVVMGDDASIILDKVTSDDDQSTSIYGAYVTGETSDALIQFDIDSPMYALYVDGGARVTLENCSLRGKDVEAQGQGTHLVIKDNVAIDAEILVTDGAAVQTECSNWTDFDLSCEEGAVLKIRSNVSVSGAKMLMEEGCTLNLNTYSSLSVDATSSFDLEQGVSIVIDLSGLAESVDYTLFSFADNALCAEVFNLLNDSSSTSLKFDSFPIADYGDTPVDYMSVQYNLDGNDIRVKTVCSISLGYYKWERSAAGQLILTSTTKDDADLSVYSSSKDAIRSGSNGQDVLHSFENLWSENGGAITNDATSIGAITGDFIANAATQGNGGAISNTAGGLIGPITGDFVGNYAVSDAGSCGGAIYNTAVMSLNGGNFIGNSAGQGGAIYNAGQMDVRALSANIEFRDNEASEGEAIYNAQDAVLNLLAADDKSISFDDSLVNQGTLNIGSDEYTGTVVLKSQSADGSTANLSGCGTTNLVGGTLYFASSEGGVNNLCVIGSDQTLVLKGGHISLGDGINSEANLGKVQLEGAVSLSLDLDMSTGNCSWDSLSADSLEIVNSDAKIMITTINIGKDDAMTRHFVIADDVLCGAIELADELTVNCSGLIEYKFSYHADNGWLYCASGDYILESYYQDAVTTSNAKAGAGLLDYVMLTAVPDSNSDLGLVMKSIRDAITTQNFTKADRLTAAVAGASVTALGSAQMQDMTRQLNNLKRRTDENMQLKGKLGEDGLEYSAWISADSGYSSLNQDGTAAGYSLSTVGGSLGADIRVSDALSLGAAYSAGYGDLDSKATDAGKGDFDTQYITLYASYNQKEWTHSFVASLGMTDADLTRTVAHAHGFYKSKGETDGISYAFAYEVSRAFALNEEKSSFIKPTIALSYINGKMDAYTEHGSDAALTIGKQENHIFRLSAGAQLEGALSHNLTGGPVMGYARAMLAFDMGDRASVADVSFRDYQGKSQCVEGTEYGRLGVDLGLGISIPVSAKSCIFADVNAELRSEASSISANLGYSFSF